MVITKKNVITINLQKTGKDGGILIGHAGDMAQCAKESVTIALGAELHAGIVGAQPLGDTEDR